MKFPLVVLVVLDGWGLAPPSLANAISQANLPNFNKFWASFPHTELAAAGEAVGLPRGEPGNTETGHLNLGAGQIIYQDLPRINLTIANGSFFKNEVFLGAIEHAKKNKSNLHLMGLISTGAVHSSLEHLLALIHLCRQQNFNRVFIHAFTDGRDAPPSAALSPISQLEEVMRKENVGQIASVMGRYWALDRDFRWERTAKAYFALTAGRGTTAKTAAEAVEQAYEANITDEFIEPTLITRGGKPLSLVGENDAVIFFNFRIDRPRQLTKAFVWDDFEEAQKDWGFDPYQVKYAKKHEVEIPQVSPFKRGSKIKNLYFATMTEYGSPLGEKTHVAFPPTAVKFPLGAVIAEKGWRQLRLAESEKERFVTYYFNGQNEKPFPGEEWVIVKSPAVATYDQKPEMSAAEITQAFLEKVGQAPPSPYRFVLINFANADMVSHTGVREAVIQSCEFVDQMLGKIVARVDLLGGVTLITGDHGNAEQLLSPTTGQPKTEHTANPVPFIVAGQPFLGKALTLPKGILADVGPTILKLLGLAIPSSMTGRVLLP